MCEFEEVQWAQCVLDAEIFRLVSLRIEVLDAPLLDVLFLEPADDLFVGIHLEFLPHLLQLDFLLALPLDLLGRFLLSQSAHNQDFAALLHVLCERLLILWLY